MTRTLDPRDDSPQGERIDKWLWVARLFKTRSLAAAALDSGKVEVNGERAKRAKTVVAGDLVSVRSGPHLITVAVTGITARRVSAKEAALLYEETGESQRRRQEVKAQLASLPFRDPGRGKPSKKERRQIDRLRDNPS